MVQSGGSLDATVVEISDNSAETLAAFELQSQEFQRVQSNFENYMERLKDDIDLKAEKFGHIEYYDAKLRDGNANELAVAADEIHDLDSRRKPLASVNPLFAKVSELPPAPQVEDITFEHISLNLPNIAKNALAELNGDSAETPETEFSDNETVFENEVVEEAIVEETFAPEGSNIPTEDIETPDNEDEPYIYDESELQELDDEALLDIATEFGIEFEGESVERKEIIAAILDAQDENSDNE